MSNNSVSNQVGRWCCAGTSGSSSHLTSGGSTNHSSISRQMTGEVRNSSMATYTDDILGIIPDIVLISVFKYLSLEDLVNVSRLSDRLAALTRERCLARNCNFEGFLLAREEDVRYHVGACRQNIERLTFNHCHWLPARTIQWAIQSCKNLRELHLIECRLRTQTLVNLLATQQHLEALSFSIATFADITRDMFDAAQGALKTLRRLHLYYTSTEMVLMRYLGESATILDYCHNLEELHIDSAGMAVPELYRPIISNPAVYSKLKVLSLTPNIHAGAQMFFYGTLQQLPNAKLPWRTLLMPNVNFCEFARKPEFRECLKEIDKLENLDLSGSRVEIPNQVVDFRNAVNLRYLNLRSKLQRYTDKELRHVLSSCSRLASLNLAGCAWTLESNPSDTGDFGGLELLFQKQCNLRHLNISGEHQHFYGKCHRLLSQFKGLEGLSIPVCMLCQQNPSTVRTGKRVMSTQPACRQAPKRRLTHNGPVPGDAGSAAADQAGSSSSSPSTSAACPQPAPPSALGRLVENCPKLKELEVLAVGFDSAVQRNKFINPKLPQFQPCIETRFVRDVALEPISQLKYLRRLTLAGLPGLTTSESLVQIAESCQHLEFLSLAYIGSSSFSGSLCRALSFCANLKDFRMEQPHMALHRAFFDALSGCSRLERLCLIAKNSVFQPQDVTRMVDQLRRLVVVQILAAGTITACKSLTTSLTKKYGKSRPGLSLTFFPLMYDGVAEVVTAIPAKHMEELTRFESHVANAPPP